jgi:SHS2 domain-containing protein
MAGKERPSRNARRKKYRQIPHTADLAWRIWGDSLPELFENAARALVATMADLRFIRRKQTREISLESTDQEALLVDWLNHLLYLFDVDAFLGRDFKITALSPQRLEAVASGELFDPGRHVEKTAVKAATFHNLEIIPKDHGWQATVVLDL